MGEDVNLQDLADVQGEIMTKIESEEAQKLWNQSEVASTHNPKLPKPVTQLSLILISM